MDEHTNTRDTTTDADAPSATPGGLEAEAAASPGGARWVSAQTDAVRSLARHIKSLRF